MKNNIGKIITQENNIHNIFIKYIPTQLLSKLYAHKIILNSNKSRSTLNPDKKSIDGIITMPSSTQKDSFIKGAINHYGWGETIDPKSLIKGSFVKTISDVVYTTNPNPITGFLNIQLEGGSII